MQNDAPTVTERPARVRSLDPAVPADLPDGPAWDKLLADIYAAPDVPLIECLPDHGTDEER